MQELAESYPVQIICWVWETARSTYYYQSQAKEESELRATLQRLAGEWPRYGSRRLSAQLQREGVQVNRKRVQRLMRAATRPKPVGKAFEVDLVYLVEDRHHSLLNNFVFQRRDA